MNRSDTRYNSEHRSLDSKKKYGILKFNTHEIALIMKYGERQYITSLFFAISKSPYTNFQKYIIYQYPYILFKPKFPDSYTNKSFTFSYCSLTNNNMHNAKTEDVTDIEFNNISV